MHSIRDPGLGWQRMKGKNVMLCAAYLIEKHDDEIVAFETWANGKPYEQSANVEVLMLVRQIRYYAGWAGRLHGLTIPADGG
ncbi:unnamed protein product [Lupinus luteus]|uniref:Aldehyde dehydrogenase domain-containing protein n=1 Tax=Lupinus luteus TaxID=3873 RepID=A0AAV1YQ66_LUPLU